MRKKFLGFCLCFVLVLSSLGPVWAAQVQIDGQKIASDVEPQIVRSRVMVPIKAISESLGAAVSWDPENRTVTIQKQGGDVIVLTLDSNRALINDQPVMLDAPARALLGRTMVPLNFVATALGATVSWDPSSKTAFVSTSSPSALHVPDAQAPTSNAPGTPSSGITSLADNIIVIDASGKGTSKPAPKPAAPSPAATPAQTPSPVAPAPSATPTATPAATPAPTATPTATPSATPAPTATPTATPSATPTPTATPTIPPASKPETPANAMPSSSVTNPAPLSPEDLAKQQNAPAYVISKEDTASPVVTLNSFLHPDALPKADVTPLSAEKIKTYYDFLQSPQLAYFRKVQENLKEKQAITYSEQTDLSTNKLVSISLKPGNEESIRALKELYGAFWLIENTGFPPEHPLFPLVKNFSDPRQKIGTYLNSLTFLEEKGKDRKYAPIAKNLIKLHNEAINKSIKAFRYDNPSTSPESAYAEQVLAFTNAERVKENLPPLTWNDTLAKGAQIRTAELPTSFSHTRPNGTDCFTALQEIGFSVGMVGENIAKGQLSPEEVVIGWMNSPGHRSNIMKPEFRHLGVGYLKKDGTTYWTQMFSD